MRVGSKIVLLTVGMVVLAGVLSAGAALWHTLRLSSSYDEALKMELEERALAYSVTAQAFLNALGPEAPGVLQAILESAPAESAPGTVADPLEAAFADLEGFEVWLPDSSARGGYRLLERQEFGDTGASVRSEEALLRMLDQTTASQDAAAVIDEDAHLILSSAFISLDGQTVAVAVATLSAEDEFAFFAAQRQAAIRNGILLSVAIIAFVSVVGGGLSYLVSHHLTERKRVEQALRRSEERCRWLIESAPDAMVVVDNDGLITMVNTQTEKLFGYGAHELLGKPVELLIPERFREAHVGHRTDYHANPSPRPMGADIDHLVGRRKDRSEFPAEISLSSMTTSRDALVTASIRDVTERKRAEEALREQARRDSLTGALNHAAIVDELRSLLAESGEGASHAVAMVDVDGLKAVNDTFGHQVGDAVLVAVAKALSKDSAVVGRYGGDEFVTVIAGADRAAAERYRDAVLDELAHVGLSDPETGAGVPIVASIGLAIYPDEAGTVADIIRMSDNALYASRRQRPVRAAGLSPARPLGSDRAAEMVGQLVPLLTSPIQLEDKLRLVAHHISVGAGYDAVNIDIFSQPSSPSSERNVFARVPDEVIESWRAERHRVEDDPFAQLLVRNRRAVIVEDPQNDERLTETQRSVLRAAELRSAVVVPLFWADELIGILAAASKREAAFGAQDVQFLTTVATQVTAIVRMATLVDELQSTSTRLERAQEEAVIMLAAAAEAHDHTTGLHLHSVRSITEALASELGISDGAAKDLGLAAVLHDIGKVRVPDSILTSRGALADEEWNLMKQHTTWGYEFLAGHEGYELAAAIARSHHERWDGNGYPDGLAGHSIPEAATIVTVADTFDAMTSDRPYRKARSVAAMVREIVALSGEQFSPNVVNALVRLHKRGVLTSSSKRVSHHRAAA